MRGLPRYGLLCFTSQARYSLEVAEEFGIYLNYVRKLGFEETPDYDFLRELFAKVMKNNGDVEDGVYDWNLLNGLFCSSLARETSLTLLPRWERLGSERGQWLSSAVFFWAVLIASWLQGQNQILAQIQNTPANAAHDRRKEAAREDRRRASQAGGAGAVLPPSPAVVRTTSKQQPRQIPAALTPGGTPGQSTPMSAAAQVNVQIDTPNRRSQQLGPQHPYASAAYDSYGRNDQVDEYSATQQQYGRASPMVSSVGAAPPAVSPVRAMGGEHGVANGGDYHGQAGEERPKNTLWQILTCRCG